MKKPHVLLDLSVLNRRQHTGLERFSLHVAQALIRRQNYSYSTLASSESGIKFPRTRQVSLEIPNNHTIEAQRELAFWADDAKADLVMGTFYPVPERKSFKTVFTIHDLIPLRLPELYKGYQQYELCDKAFRDSARHADAILAISEATKRDIIEIFGTPASRIHIITEAADARFKPLIKDPYWPQIQKKYKLRQPYLLAVCTTSKHKNLARVLEAFKIVKAQAWARDLQLVLVGMAGSSNEELIRSIAEHKYASDIIRTGYFPDTLLPSLYRHARAFVWPSLYEGFGLPLLEAMQCGTAVVTSTLSSIPEVVGDTAFNCDAYRSEAIANAIESAVTDETLRAKKISAGLKRAATFTWDRTAGQIEKVFTRLLK